MKKEKMKLAFWGVGVLILVLFIASGILSAQTKAPAAPFKIGIVTSITGPAYGYAQRAIIGVRYRIEQEINKAGGINGHPVQLITYDTGTKAEQAAMLTERAAMVDKVFAILGPNSSSDVAAAFPTAKRLGVPDVAMGGTLRGICEQNAPWAFATMMSSDFSMEPLAMVIDQCKAKSMVIMVDAKYNYAVSQGADGYKIAARKGVKVLNPKGKLDVETGWADFTPQVTEIKSLNPDLICAILFPVDTAHLAIALKGGGIDIKRVPTFISLMLTDEFAIAAGAAGYGIYGSQDLDLQSTDPVEVAWRKKITDYGKTVTNDKAIYTLSSNTSCGYDAAAFLCEAIKRTKITPSTPLEEARKKIRDELPKIKMKTYSSKEFYFGKGGRFEKNRLVKPMFLTEDKEGKVVVTGQLAE